MKTFADVRHAISGHTKPSDLRGGVIFCTVALAYVAALAGFCITASWPRWLFLALATFLVGQLFIIGHDACHLALVRNSRLNRIIGRLAFAPTLHPFSAWEIGHNRRHHGFTNLRHFDYVWCPWSADEFAAASVHRRALYRLYHTPLGIGLYYPIEIWLKHMWGADVNDRAYRDYTRVAGDRVTAAFGFLTIAGACLLLCLRAGFSFTSAVTNAVLAVVVPLLFYHYLMSVVIFVHHRHRDVAWFDSSNDYSPFTAQIRGTVHATLPRAVELAFLDIFQHTAHHADPRIPLYGLASSQRILESNWASLILRTPLSVKTFLEILSSCQLYDYERKLWLAIKDVPRVDAPKLQHANDAITGSPYTSSNREQKV